MANLPPPNHVTNLPEDDPEEQPELAPEPDHLNEFALHQNPQPEGNMNGWILEDDEEEEEEEDPKMEEEMDEENNDDDDDADAEAINPYEEADPLNLPPTDSDTESEDTAVAPTPDDHELEAEADTVGTITRVPYSVRLFSGTVYVGSRPSRQVLLLALQEGMSILYIARHYRKRPYVAPTAPVAYVDRANPDDPSPYPTRRPRHDDPYVMVRDASTRNEGDDAATTSNPQPSQPPGSPHYHLIMPPRAMTQAAIEKLISDRMAAALAQDRATRGNTNGAGGSGGNFRGNAGGQGGAPPAREYTISECAERNKVKFDAATLQGRALTWWNSQVATLGLEVANVKSWNDMKIMMREEFCPPEEIQRKEVELRNLRVKDSNISAYTQRFNELVMLFPEMVPSEKKKVEAYLRGLPKNIKGETTSSRPVVLNEAV
ncbi:putative reverse transcriptase domain-containing protein [Tanacetum coccineum]|uniref:Reverse transcriptase domain-containing protein n=1 Tax=Tanacetum coccineum TaxID=301880 RepID=A0ABQ5FX22_9ASTR